ncbi:MAG: C39 family peptidase [Candidatus Heimdallarchaeota archaeon]
MRKLPVRIVGMIFLTLLIFTFINYSYTHSNSMIPNDTVVFKKRIFRSSRYMIPNVPYVWQEVNGLCAWASLNAVFRYFDANTTLARLLDVSGTGFGFLYLRADPTLLFFTGPLGSQIPDTDFLAKIYGFNITWYFGEETPGIDQLKPVLEEHDMNVIMLPSFSDGLEALKQDLHNNIPVVVSINPLRFSTIRDYQAIALPNTVIVGHGVVVVGYNNTHIFVNDPGVGSFGNEYGFPTDQRGTYAPIPLEDFQLAWEDRDLLATKFIPKPDFNFAAEKLYGHAIERIIAKLEGDESAYSYSQVMMWLGADAFLKMGTDVQPEEFEEILNNWDDYFEQNRTQLVTTVASVKMAYLGALTLTYEAMQRAATDLSALLYGLDPYVDALNSLDHALNQFDDLVDFAVLQFLGDDSKRMNQTLFDEAFDPLIQALKEGRSLDTALQTSATQFETLSTQITNIGSALKTFSETLKAAHTPYVPEPHLILQFVLFNIILVIVTKSVRRKIQRY